MVDPTQINVTLQLSLAEVDAILFAIGEVPTKTGLFTLGMKLKSQAEAQIPKEEPAVEAETVEQK